MAQNLIRLKQLEQSELSGFLSQAIVNSGIISSVINNIGSGLFISVSGDQKASGVKTFLNNINISGDLNVAGNLYVDDINGNNSFGDYMLPVHTEDANLFKTYYIKNNVAQNIPITGLKTGNTISIYSYDRENDTHHSNLKVFQYVLGGPKTTTHNSISITGGMYSGYGLRKIKNGPTISNNYKNITSLESGGSIIALKQRYLETVYNINVESGKGDLRRLYFTQPVMNVANNPIITLKFNFKADNNPCVVSGGCNSDPYETIFKITGANYDFVQIERLMYHYNGGVNPYVRI